VSVLSSLVHKKIVDFLPILCRVQPEVAEVHFETFRPGPGLSERLHNALENESDKELVAAADRICLESGVPFWEALAAIAMRKGEFEERFIQIALFHVPNPSTIPFALTAGDVLNGGVTEIAARVPEGNALAVCSKVRLQTGESMHVPMMDFACPCSDGNARAVAKMLKIIGQDEGIIAESGRSYHFYGISLLTHERWIDFMAKAMLFAPYVDPRYVAHRLADGQCRLRIYSPRPMPVITRILSEL
jgi:hypothetical protein